MPASKAERQYGMLLSHAFGKVNLTTTIKSCRSTRAYFIRLPLLSTLALMIVVGHVYKFVCVVGFGAKLKERFIIW